MTNLKRDPVVAPWDRSNRELVANVRPGDWENPEPAEMYNLVVIGAGTAGLVTAAGAAWLGAKVALVEKHLLGGDCLNTGCVPSKTLIRSSRAAAGITEAPIFGIRVPGGSAVDFAAVMERVRSVRARVSSDDSAERLTSLGVDVFFGDARFTGPDTVVVGGDELRFRKAVIATGARAVRPHIDGVEEAGYLTNETVFSITEQPSSLAVIGGGPIGCELAQAFQRLGTQVTLFHKHGHILDREDPDAAEIVQERFRKEGIDLLLGCSPSRIEITGDGKLVHYSCEGRESSVLVDEIISGAGRAPNTEDLGLDLAGVDFDKRKGVIVNDRLQTTNPRIFAAGDVCMKWKFTHAADAAARIVIQNALFKGRKKLGTLTMPWCTYTDPEIAHVGMYQSEAEARGLGIDTFTRKMHEVDRAMTDGEEEGFVKVHVFKGTDRIAGATIVAGHAGDMISEISLAMVSGIGLGRITNAIHPYPTQAEAIHQLSDEYNRTRLTPMLKKIIEGWMKWQRR